MANVVVAVAIVGDDTAVATTAAVAVLCVLRNLVVCIRSPKQLPRSDAHQSKHAHSLAPRHAPAPPCSVVRSCTIILIASVQRSPTKESMPRLT